MEPATFNAIFSVVMLALGSWCVKEGVEITIQRPALSSLTKFAVLCTAAMPEACLFLSALNADMPDFALGILSGTVFTLGALGVGVVILINSSSRSGSTGLDKSIRAQAKLLALTAPLMLCIMLDGFCLSFGVMGAMEFIVFVYYSLPGRKSTVSLKKMDRDVEGGSSGSGAAEPAGKGIMFVGLGCLIAYLFSDDFVRSTVQLGPPLGVSRLFLSTVLAPLALEAAGFAEVLGLATQGGVGMNRALNALLCSCISKTTLLTGILSGFGYIYNHHWAFGVYSVSMFMLLCTVFAVSAALSIPSSVRSPYGYTLIMLFVVVMVAQYSLAPGIHHGFTESGISSFGLPDSLNTLSTGGAAAGSHPSMQMGPRDIIGEISLTPYN